MATYYGVERSSEYLEHYGIRGMKWGVRRALERGDRNALRKHYQKAALKLGKLSLNANRGVQQRIYNSAKARMASGALGSALGSAGLTAALNNDLKSAGIAGAAGLAVGALANSRGITAGRHTTDRGHARAIRKRDEFRREMESTFKNTGVAPNMKEMQRFHNQITAISDQDDPQRYVRKQYGKAVRDANKLIKRNERANQTYREGLRAGAIGAVGGVGAANAHTARNIADHEEYARTYEQVARKERGPASLRSVSLNHEKQGKLSTKQSHIKDPKTRKLAESYAKNYNWGIDNGMDPEGATTYANDHFNSSTKKRRHR